MTGIYRRLLLAVLMGAIIGLPILTRHAPEARLYAGTSRLKFLEKEFVDAHEKVRDGVVAVLVGNEMFTGFFISEDGLMLTNGDVTKAAARSPVVVHFHTGERRSAKFVAADPYNYICLIKVEGRGYKPLEFGHSGSVKVGQIVMTVGNAFGSIQNDEQAAFSIGMVSGLYRLTGDIGYRGDVIETDAAVNGGVEGAPLVDIKGRVVGVAARGYCRARFLGTAVPIDQVKLTLDDLKLNRPIYSGYFGAAFEGTVISSVDKGSPAEMAGLKKGDKITEIDTVLVNSEQDIKQVLGNSPAGCTTNIAVRRGEEELILRVTLGKGISGKEIKPPAVVMGPGPGVPAKAVPWLGFTLVDRGGGRVEVLKVAPGSPAAGAGITQGLRLLSVNGKIIGSVAAFDVLFRSVRTGRQLVLEMENKDGWKRDFKVTVGAKVGKDF